MKIIRLFDSSEQNIFRRISNILQYSWFDSDFADDINVEYFLGHSGNKSTSLLVDRLIEVDNLLVDDGGHIIIDDDGEPMIADVSGGQYQDVLARLIARNFGKKWNTYFATLEENYNPLLADSEKTIVTPRVTQTSESNTASKVTSSTENKGSENLVQGFNSTGYSPSDKSVGTTESISEGAFDDNHSRNIVSTEGENTSVTTREGGDYSSRVDDYRRIMSINLIEMIIHDVDMVMTLPYYSKY